MDIVRVLRIIEYSGPREDVEEQIRGSLHGERKGIRHVTIRAATIGEFPEILERDHIPFKESFSVDLDKEYPF